MSLPHCSTRTVHVINHTHWDREWFLTHEYTTAWIPELLASLDELATGNPAYEFLLDGQTLAAEDLLSSFPDERDRLTRLVSSGNLAIGPVYSQPDWRMTSGESHVRNLLYGRADAAAVGGSPDIAWLVDTFGHISQAPQLLRLAGIRAAFVWRGVPELAPLFRWRGADQSELPTIDLFGGYRNLYGIAKTLDIAVDRLVAEVDKLSPWYGELPIPMFDGYDLDTEPEDPTALYAELAVPDNIDLVASSPGTYVDAVTGTAQTAPVIEGELLSGKFGSTFPGSLSARTYLKLLHHDAEVALHRRAEPLAALASLTGRPWSADVFERASRELLQNAVHDCLCGVSIDQVHERMDRSYRELLDLAATEAKGATEHLLSGFASGCYAVSLNPIPDSMTMRTKGRAIEVAASGVGVVPAPTHPVTAIDESVPSFEWTNDYYSARVDSSGLTIDGIGALARLIVVADNGDTYSSEPGEIIGEMAMVDQPVVLDRSAIDTIVRTEWSLHDADREVQVTAQIDARFDAGPRVELTINLDSSGTDFRVDCAFATSVGGSTIHAGMPFDTVERDHDDGDLLPHDLDADLDGVLMGQREIGRVTEFPFHDFVAATDGTVTQAVLARGVRSYHSTADTITITLRRSVEWLAQSGLTLRAGDAGPAMYVPLARCERPITHQLAFAVVDGHPTDPRFVGAVDSFINPAIVADVEHDKGASSDSAPAEWRGFGAELSLASLTPAPVDGGQARSGAVLVRMHNPAERDTVLPAGCTRTALDGTEPSAATQRPDMAGRGEIVTGTVAIASPPSPGYGTVRVDHGIVCRVGPNRSAPNSEVLVDLERRIHNLRVAAEALALELADDARWSGDSVGRHLATHRHYVLAREQLELELSLELNQRRLSSDQIVSIPDEADATIADLGRRLNDLRVKRRIYDYVAVALQPSC